MPCPPLGWFIYNQEIRNCIDNRRLERNWNDDWCLDQSAKTTKLIPTIIKPPKTARCIWDVVCTSNSWFRNKYFSDKTNPLKQSNYCRRKGPCFEKSVGDPRVENKGSKNHNQSLQILCFFGVLFFFFFFLAA